MKKFFTLLLVTAFLVSAMIAVGGNRAQAEETIKIGAILNLTGPVGFIGPLFKNGIVKALEETNYTVNGKKIQLITEDAAADMNVCLQKSRKLVERLTGSAARRTIRTVFGRTERCSPPRCRGD